MTWDRRSALTMEAVPKSFPKLIPNQVGDGIQSTNQYDSEYAMTLSFDAKSLADHLRRVFVKVTRTNQVRQVSF